MNGEKTLGNVNSASERPKRVTIRGCWTSVVRTVLLTHKTRAGLEETFIFTMCCYFFFLLILIYILVLDSKRSEEIYHYQVGLMYLLTFLTASLFFLFNPFSTETHFIFILPINC